MSKDNFASVIARLLLNGESASEQAHDLVQRVLNYAHTNEQLNHWEALRRIAASPPGREHLQELQREIRAAFGARDSIALVYGGATKIKEYVFEAPRLSEVRGASALLDWVNDVRLPALWAVQSNGDADARHRLFVDQGIIYAGGGNILAFAPADQSEDRAAQIERTYTDETLTANSYGVAQTFSLLELRFGRLAWSGDTLRYWLEDFEADWQDKAKRKELKDYYYLPTDAVEAGDSEAFQARLRFFNRKVFGELVTLLATKANRRRDERQYGAPARHVPIAALIPWAEKCDSSDIRPVVLQQRADDQREDQPPQLSEASARKYKAGRILKKADADTGLADQLQWKPEGIDKRSWETLWQAYLDDHPDLPYHRSSQQANSPPMKQIKPPQDLGEIGQASQPDRYVGVIYADGNNVGRVVATAQTPNAMSELSRALSDTAREAVFAALGQYLAPAEVRSERGHQRWIHPFEILSIGGDDLFLIVPGDHACDIALAIGWEFEKALADNPQLIRPQAAKSSAAVPGRYSAETQFTTAPYTPSIGLSAGVLIAPENTPIFFLERLVRELLDKSAKVKAREAAQDGFFGGAVDFMVLKSITMVVDKIKAFRVQAYRTDTPTALTARPYSWHEFAGLLATVRALKQAQVPRSQLHRLRRALDEDRAATPLASVMEYLYTRVRRPAYEEALKMHVERPWCYRSNADGRTGLPPWMPRAGGWETMWADMLELHELVPEQQ